MIEHVQIDCTTGMACVSDEPGPDQHRAMVAAMAGRGQRQQQERDAEARRAAIARLQARSLQDGVLTTDSLKDLMLAMGLM